MNGGRCSTTRIWRPPSSTASWSADGSFASMDPRDELVISSWRTPCQAVPNGSEYLEYVAQNFRNPQRVSQSDMATQLPKQKGGVTPSFSCSPIRVPHVVSEYSWQSLPQYRATSRSQDLSDSCTGLPAPWRR